MSDRKRIVAEQISHVLNAMRPELHRYISRMVLRDSLAEEIVQQAAVRALEAVDRAPRVEAELRPWLYRIATRLAIDVRRKHSFQKEHLMVDLREQAEANPNYLERAQELAGTPETKSVAREHLLYCFRCTLQHLTEDQAAALLLKEINGFSNGETAAALDLTETQVKNRVQEARRELRKRYQKSCALAEQTGVCHQCKELDDFFQANQGDPLANTDGGITARLRIIREHEPKPMGPWTSMLESLLDSIEFG